MGAPCLPGNGNDEVKEIKSVGELCLVCFLVRAVLLVVANGHFENLECYDEDY